MFFLKPCSACGQVILFGFRTQGVLRFCGAACQRAVRHPGFCASCLACTSDEGEGAHNINMVGTALLGGWAPCATCGSEEVLKAVVVLVPIIPVARFRVIRFGRSDGRILSRRVPGPAMSRQLWMRLVFGLVVAVAFWAIFIGVIVLKS
jgi:hypothetical protein